MTERASHQQGSSGQRRGKQRGRGEISTTHDSSLSVHLFAFASSVHLFAFASKSASRVLQHGDRATSCLRCGG